MEREGEGLEQEQERALFLSAPRRSKALFIVSVFRRGLELHFNRISFYLIGGTSILRFLLRLSTSLRSL